MVRIITTANFLLGNGEVLGTHQINTFTIKNTLKVDPGTTAEPIMVDMSQTLPLSQTTNS